MTTSVAALPERGDFRCGLCQMKNAFHCEHDTPYRDQYLGMFDPSYPRDAAVNTEKYQQPKSVSREGQYVNKPQPVPVRNEPSSKPTVAAKKAAAKSCVIQ